jgi:hypothetical protein
VAQAVARIDARDGARFHESSGAAPSDEAVAATPRDLGDVTAFRGGEPRRGRKRPRDQSASTAAATDAADVAATSTHAAAAAEAALASQFHAAYASFCGGASRLQALPPASLWALWCCVHCWGGHASVTTRRLWRYVTHALRAHGAHSSHACVAVCPWRGDVTTHTGVGLLCALQARRL